MGHDSRKIQKNDFAITDGNVAIWTGVRIPHALVARFTEWAREVYNAHKCECFAFITQDFATGEVGLQVVEQEAIGLSVDWTNEIPQGKRQIGTIHSHCDADAFFSITDTDTYETVSGLHLCVGNLGKKKATYAVCIRVGNKTIEIEEIPFEEWDNTEWDKKLQVRKRSSSRLRRDSNTPAISTGVVAPTEAEVEAYRRRQIREGQFVSADWGAGGEQGNFLDEEDGRLDSIEGFWGDPFFDETQY